MYTQLKKLQQLLHSEWHMEFTNVSRLHLTKFLYYGKNANFSNSTQEKCESDSFVFNQEYDNLFFQLLNLGNMSGTKAIFYLSNIKLIKFGKNMEKSLKFRGKYMRTNVVIFHGHMTRKSFGKIFHFSIPFTKDKYWPAGSVSCSSSSDGNSLSNQ